MKHPPDLAALVEETRGCKTKCGIDLDKDVQPYDSDDSGVCQLASETAEWWGPEWGSDEDDPDVTRMTTVRPFSAHHTVAHEGIPVALLDDRMLNCCSNSPVDLIVH